MIGVSLVLVTVFNIGFNIILIPYIGIHGASISTLLSQIILFVLILRAAQKIYPIPYEINKVILLITIVSFLSMSSFFLNDNQFW
ncbi:MAG: hypothetical protein HC905_28665 [Bacteroidales bacterium]|nr:hypothetical protein [Bacteroidales bacterium]